MFMTPGMQSVHNKHDNDNNNNEIMLKIQTETCKHIQDNMFNTAIDNKKHILHISTNKCFFAVQIYADKHLYTDKLLL